MASLGRPSHKATGIGQASRWADERHSWRYHAGMPDESRPPATPHPLDLLWKAPAVMWVLLAGEALAVMLALAPGVSLPRWVYFGLLSLLIQWITLLTLGGLYLARQRLRRIPPQHVAWLAVLLLGVVASLLSVAVWKFLPGVLVAPEEALLQSWLRAAGLMAVAGTLAALAFQNHWRSRLLAVRAKQAELDALRARVDPHFLFNTLNTATALVHTEPGRAEQVLLDLSDLFRAALSGSGEHGLAEELALTRRYLEIEGLRLGERLQVAWQLPSPLPSVRLPTLALQTLVENAVRHGVERLPGGGMVRIEATPIDGTLRLRVENPVAGDAGRDAPGHRVGLAATRARVEALTEGRGGLETRVIDGRFIAELRIPMGG